MLTRIFAVDPAEQLLPRRSVAALPGFGFLELGDDVPFTAVQVVRNGGALCLDNSGRSCPAWWWKREGS
jgi:hypothetical protein